jgi:hypothetical protein
MYHVREERDFITGIDQFAILNGFMVLFLAWQELFWQDGLTPVGYAY